MDVYGTSKTSNWPGILLVIVQLLLICIAVTLFALGYFPRSSYNRELLMMASITLLCFDFLTFSRFFFTLFVFLKRRISTDELAGIPIAFAIYYVGFLFLTFFGGTPSVIATIAGIMFFFLGSLTNSLSELQRHHWKMQPSNSGRLCRSGIYSISRHPNYLGDVVWVLGYSLVSGNVWSLLIPVLLAFFFWKGNIPMQEKYLVEKYGDQMKEYQKATKSLVPFVF